MLGNNTLHSLPVSPLRLVYKQYMENLKNQPQTPADTVRQPQWPVLPGMLFRQHIRIVSSAASSEKKPVTALPSSDVPPSEFQFVRRIGADVTAAGVTGISLGFGITLVDMSIIKAVSNKLSIKEVFKENMYRILTSPKSYVMGKPFQVVTAVYVATYGTANLASTLAEYFKLNPFEKDMCKLLPTSWVNIQLGVMKDMYLASIFSPKPPAKPPFIPKALFYTRDFMTMGASFVLPHHIAEHLQHSFPYFKDKPDLAMNLAQLSCPVAVQVLSTPLHLTGITLFNNPAVTQAELAAAVAANFKAAFLLRCARIFYGFGIGGVVNRVTREAILNDK